MRKQRKTVLVTAVRVIFAGSTKPLKFRSSLPCGRDAYDAALSNRAATVPGFLAGGGETLVLDATGLHLLVGDDLVHEEGAIMIRTVLRCLEQGVVVLPLHDGLLVAEQHNEVAREAMHEAFREHTGGFVARISK